MDDSHYFSAKEISIPKFAVLARSKQLHSEVSILVCGLQGHLLWHRGILQKSAPRFHLTKATKQWRIVAIPYQKAWGPWDKGHEAMTNCRDSLPKSLRSLRGAARSTGAADASIMHAKDRVVVSKIWIARYCANPWRIVQDSAFSNSGLEVGLPAFQLPMFSKCDALPKRRFVWHVCQRNPSLLWNLSLHCLPEAWGPWEPQYASAPPILHYACIMPIPSLQLQKKDRVSCKEAKGLVTELWSPRFVIYIQYSDIQWLCPRFGLQGIDCALSCDTWLLQTNEIQWTIVEIDKIEILASVGWKWGCQPFSCPCSRNVMHCRKQICLTCLSKESMPFVKSKPPLPTRSLRSLRAAVCFSSTNSALCLYHAHPFVAAAEKRSVSCREAKGLVPELWSPRIVAIYWLLLYDCCKESF